MKLLEDIEEFVKERKQHDQKNMELVDRARKFPWCRGIPPEDGARVYHLKNGPGVVISRVPSSSSIYVKFDADTRECGIYCAWTDLIDLRILTLFGRELTLNSEEGYYYCNKEKPFLYVYEPGRGVNVTEEWKAAVNTSSGSIQASGCCIEEAEDNLKGKMKAKCAEMLEEVDKLHTLIKGEQA